MFGLFVKYNGDSHFTHIESRDASGTVEQIGAYLVKNYKYIVNLGGASEIYILPLDNQNKGPESITTL